MSERNFSINQIDKNNVDAKETLLQHLYNLDSKNNLTHWAVASYKEKIFYDYKIWTISVATNGKLISDIKHIIGFCLVQQVLDEAEILTVVIDKSHQRQGLAGQLLSKIIDDFKTLQISKVHLEVRANNEPALKLYKSLGFKELGLRKNYYRDYRHQASNSYLDSMPNRDAILMSKDIS